MPVIPAAHIPLRDSHINFDVSGVAGFFGGDAAASAMATHVSLYSRRKWFGWYNSLGSYEVAKRYGRLAGSSFWGGLYPGVADSPAVLFELDGRVGPRYRGVHSGTSMDQTGHLAYLLGQQCKILPTGEWDGQKEARRTTPTDVTIVKLHHVPLKSQKLHQAPSVYTTLLTFVPIVSSLTACLVCAFIADWWCFSIIALGMFSNGMSGLVIGSGKVTLTHPTPADGAPPGDGILMDNEQVVILLGDEGAVNTITRGRFSLDYKSCPHYRDFGCLSMLLTIQFLLQLLAMPQGTLFGQVMFLSSIAAFWLYACFLSPVDKEYIQRRVLMQEVLKDPGMYKYQLGTRTTTVVFVMLVLSSSQSMEGDAMRELLKHILPNDTKVWRSWKKTVVKEIQQLRSERKEPVFQSALDPEFQTAEVQLLEKLDIDAQNAYKAFQAYM